MWLYQFCCNVLACTVASAEIHQVSRNPGICQPICKIVNNGVDTHRVLKARCNIRWDLSIESRAICTNNDSRVQKIGSYWIRAPVRRRISAHDASFRLSLYIIYTTSSTTSSSALFYLTHTLSVHMSLSRSDSLHFLFNELYRHHALETSFQSIRKILRVPEMMWFAKLRNIYTRGIFGKMLE